MERDNDHITLYKSCHASSSPLQPVFSSELSPEQQPLTSLDSSSGNERNQHLRQQRRGTHLAQQDLLTVGCHATPLDVLTVYNHTPLYGTMRVYQISKHHQYLATNPCIKIYNVAES